MQINSINCTQMYDVETRAIRLFLWCHFELKPSCVVLRSTLTLNFIIWHQSCFGSNIRQ